MTEYDQVILGYTLEELPENRRQFLILHRMIKICQSCELSDPREAEHDSQFCLSCFRAWDWFQETFEVPDMEEFP